MPSPGYAVTEALSMHPHSVHMLGQCVLSLCINDLLWRRRLVLIAILCSALSSCAPGEKVNNGAVPPGTFEGVWCWGSPRRSADVPFLRISRHGSAWLIETKHYMHDYFVSSAKDVCVSDHHLEFVYWYAPLNRWARCGLDLSDDNMAGQCDGELNARQWGAVPTYLWRSPS